MRHSGLGGRIAASVLMAAGVFMATGQALAAPAIVVEGRSGQVLHHDEPYALWSPASLTKLMTAYVTFRAVAAGELTMRAPVMMSPNAASEPPSKMGYRPGDVMTVDNAVKMLIIKSANDVSVALAEAVSGTEDRFVARMNAEAARLGMTNTRFVNPHGLHDAGQYSTARDLALLVRAIRTEFPQHDGYFAAEAMKAQGEVTTSYNILLGRYAGADGMKTGFVCASGFNLAATATRNGRMLIAVVMGEESQKSRAERAARLLERGFAGGGPSPDAPTLRTLIAEADADGQPANLRPVVCTEEARADRWDGRQIEGYITFDEPSIGTLDREPEALAAGLGGATGSSRAGFWLGGTFVAEIPVPKQRPVTN